MLLAETSVMMYGTEMGLTPLLPGRCHPDQHPYHLANIASRTVALRETPEGTLQVNLDKLMLLLELR
jgi:hypothetical protein